MKFKKNCLSTQLSKLYGKDDYQTHIEQNREYWWYFSSDDEISYGWYKIKITYVRSGCAFYVFSDLPEVPERFFPTSCWMGSTLVFADIDPTKDLNNFNSDIEHELYYFDDEHTIVHNWPNEKEINIKRNDPSFPIVSAMCEKIKD